MGMEQKTNFTVDKSKCVHCGNCINVCSGMVLKPGQDGCPEMKAFERFGWRGGLALPALFGGMSHRSDFDLS